MSCIAVVDVETTGLNPYRHDRIVEIAAVVMRPDGSILRDFVSLINPVRDIGPTSIHGLSASDIVSAPQFGEIVGSLVEVLDGSVAIAGHNVRFDYWFLVAEFRRLGYDFPDVPRICTMELAGGGTLTSCCATYNIDFVGEAHEALDDARATAKLLTTLLADAPRRSSEILSFPSIRWPRIPKTPASALTRDRSRQRQAEPPSYLNKLLERSLGCVDTNTDDSAELAYTALLDRVLEDRRIDDDEGAALMEVAAEWGIGGERIRQLHRNYLHHLAIAALADGVVTGSERRDLSVVSNLLGVDRDMLDETLDGALKKLSGLTPPAHPARAMSEQLHGKCVCFTGEMQCRIAGQPITRETAVSLVANEGVQVVETVTKKLDMLVVADPQTASGKAKKARQYGIRIIHEPVFWKLLGVEVE
jgi:DNA polymerase-3 subunit epsilon